MLPAKRNLREPKKYGLTYRKVCHALVNSNKRIVKFDPNISKTGVFEGWLVCHVHHVKVVLKAGFHSESRKKYYLIGPVGVHRFISVNIVQSSDSSDVESRPVELGEVQSQQFSLELLHSCQVDGVRYKLAKSCKELINPPKY